MTRHPPSVARPMTIAASVALTFVVTGGCTMQPPDNPGGLLVVANGQVHSVTDSGEVLDITGAPVGARRASAATGRIVVEDEAGTIVVSDPPAAGVARTWRELTIDGPPPGRSTAGLDLSLDGRTLAIVRGDPDTAGMDVVTVDIATGAANTRELDLMANGPPSWIGPGTLALEVVKLDQQIGIATLDVATGAVSTTQASGFEASAAGDGGLVAVASEAGVVVRKTSDWLSAAPGDGTPVPGPDGATVLDLAIDAAGTRLAVVYADPSGASASIAILRRDGATWTKVTSIQLPGDGPVVIDWLE